MRIALSSSAVWRTNFASIRWWKMETAIEDSELSGALSNFPSVLVQDFHNPALDAGRLP